MSAALDTVLERLSPEQRRAATSPSPCILVLAGAGSGKTSVLVSRIAHLQLNERVGTSNMLALTFTRLAAHEMKERVGRMIGEQLGKALTAGTFHSFCVKVLRKWGREVGLGPDFSIYDEEDRQAILEAVVTDLRYGALVKSSQVNPWARKQPNSAYEAIAKEYLYRLRQNNAIDLDGLLALTIRVLEETEAAEQIRRHYSHVFVDEYQDTDDRQERILQLIAPENLFVVGDPAQAIYGWRGARVENILSFEERHPGCEVIRLERNYRSTKSILSIANRVIAQAPFKAPLQLWTDKEPLEGMEPSVHALTDEEAEARFVVAEVQKGVREGRITSLSSVAVLARTNRQLDAVRKAFEEAGIACFVVSNANDPLDEFDVRRVLDHAAYLTNIMDGRALMRIVNWPKRRFTDLELSRMRLEATQRGVHVSEVVRERLPLHGELMQVANSDPAAWQSMSALFRLLVDWTGIRNQYEQAGLINRLDMLDSAEAAIRRWEGQQLEAGEPCDPLTFLRWLRTRDVQDRFRDQTEDAVRLMTIHAAKGLEWDHVFVIGCNDQILPSKKGDFEEERRLFYVAVTRARESLCLTYMGQRQTMWGKTQLLEPSPFLVAAGLALAS